MKTEYQIRSLSDLDHVSQRCRRVLTLFSGGVDSSYVLKELARRGSCEVIALTVDMGDGVDREELHTIASHFGAKSVVIDGRALFAREAVLPALRCNAQYMGLYPISASLSRPIICSIAIEQAALFGCDAIIHTANQSQNSLRRLNGALQQLGFEGFYGSPYEYSALTREEKIAELREFGLAKFQSRGTSGDANLWCREFESGDLDNPEQFQVPPHLFEWTAHRGPVQEGLQLSVAFREGTPVSIDDVEMPLVELIAQLNERVGAYGIGRYAGLEHLDEGEKVLEVREAPAAHLLMNAYRHLEMATLDSEMLREKLSLEQVWVREAVEGRWFAGLRGTIDHFVAQAAKGVTGVVQYQLRAGAADVCSIRAAKPRYLTDRDQWEKRVARVRGARSLAALHGWASRDAAAPAQRSAVGANELEQVE